MRFADTSFWIALQFGADSNYEAAQGIWSGEIGRVVVTNHVLGETWIFFRRRKGHTAAIETVDAIRRSRRIEVVHVDETLEREAWRWLRHHDERPYSFVDATSFALMRRRRIREALAFEGDFSAAGFVEVRP